MPGSKGLLAESLLQEADSRQASPHAKVFALTLLALGCAYAVTHHDWKEEPQAVSEPVAEFAPPTYARSHGAVAWLPAARASRSLPQQQPAVRAWQPVREPFGLRLGTIAQAYTPPVKIEKDQETVKKMFTDREAREEFFAKYDVKALRPVTNNGANVPAGTPGTLESGLIAWENGEYTLDAVRAVDYEILKKELEEKPRDPDEDILGQEVSAEDLEKAYSDLTGLAEGDIVAVQRSDGTWTYAKALKKSGTSRTGTGVGFMLTVRVRGLYSSDGATKEYPFSDWDKVKQLRAPEAGRGWGGFGRPADEALKVKLEQEKTNPLMGEIGQECSEEDLQGASSDLSEVTPGTILLVKRSNGKWTYARVIEFIGTSRSASGIKFGNPAQVAPGQAGVGMRLRVDEDSEKKVMSSEFDNLKAFKV